MLIIKYVYILNKSVAPDKRIFRLILSLFFSMKVHAVGTH